MTPTLRRISKHTEAAMGLLKLQQSKEEEGEVVIIAEIEPVQTGTPKVLPPEAEAFIPLPDLTKTRDPQPPICK